MFADKLKTLRKAKGITQEQLADVLGVTQQAVGRYEKGLNMPDNNIMIKIADYFCVSLDYLQGREDKKPLSIVGGIVGMIAALSPEKQEKAASYIAFLANEDKKA